MRISSLLWLPLVLVFSPACSDPKCRPGEQKVGTVCFERPGAASDASLVGVHADGSTDTPTGAKADASTPAPSSSDGGLADASANSDATSATDANHEGDASYDEADASSAGSEDASTSSADASTSTPPVTPPATCLTDGDADGFGVEPMNASCPAQGAPPKSGDCNDKAASAYPGGTEVCGDALDNDCNGKVDDGKPELCNGVDDDCDPSTPDGAGACGTFQCRDAKCLTTCGADTDCVGGLHCVGSSCEGSQDGAKCATDEQCTSGSCTAAKICGPKVAVNGPCNSAGDCPGGASCSANGVCKLDKDTTCLQDGDCASQVCYGKCLVSQVPLKGGCDSQADCVAGLACEQGTCKGKQGAACGADAECQSNICAGAACVLGKQDLDAACDANSDCNTGLSCVGAPLKCKGNNGTSCSQDQQCVTGSCGGAGCADRVGFTKGCNSSPDCQDGLVCKVDSCLWANGNLCGSEAECGEGTCAPAESTLVLRCRQPGFYGDLCNGPEDCNAQSYTTCSFNTTGPRFCKVQIEEDCHGDPTTCASGSCDTSGDGLCDG